MRDRWNIYLAGWVIGDGAYSTFSVGQIAEFALEFSASDSDNATEFVGTCILLTPALAVIDIGVLAYRQEGQWSTESTFSLGEKFRTRLTLLADAFENSSFTKASGEEVPLVYTWRIEAIYRCAPTDVEPVEIRETDLSGQHSYVLRCELLPMPPGNTGAR